MNYLSQHAMDMADQRRENDLRILPVTSRDILPAEQFNRLLENADKYPLAKARLKRHDCALIMCRDLNL
jgi:hypothetical protein